VRVLFVDKAMLQARRRPVRGVELFNLQLLEKLTERGLHVAIYAHRFWKGTLPAEARFIAAPPMPAVWMQAPGALVHGRRLAMREGAFDALLLGNVSKGLAPAARRLWRAGAVRRIVVYAHRATGRKFVRNMRGAPFDVVAVSRRVADRSRLHCPPDSHVAVHYGLIDPERFAPADLAGRGEDEPVRFGVLGRLDNPWKGADDAVEAFKRLPAPLRSRCELHLIACEQPLEAWERTPGVVTHRWLDHNDVPAALRRLDCLLVPSRSRETFSQAMVQGMLTGLPVIARDLPVLREKLDEGGGVVVDSVEAMAQAMTTIASDRALRVRMGAQARCVALGRYCFDVQRFIDDWLAPTSALRGR